MENKFKITNIKNSAPSPLERDGVRLKICGMKYPENILEVSQLLPDYLGFIFYEKSTRYFDEEIPEIPKSIKKVGVFVDEKQDEIISKIKKYNLDLIQLHGNETPEFCLKLKQKNIKIIKVFSVDDDFNFEDLNQYENVCDYFLFDTKGKLHGGNGVTFNWKILENYTSKKPLFLSGGIGIDEIAKVKKLNFPIFAIDVNSKFEIKPGLKNVELLNKIIINKKSVFLQNNLKNELQLIISGTGKVKHGTIIQAAANFIKGSQSSSKMAQNDKHFKSQEAEKLIQFATENNILIQDIDLTNYISEGAEQKVYLKDGLTVLKLNDAIYYNSWTDYLNNLLLNNYFFPDTAYKLLGFYLESKQLFAVVEQPFVLATDKTDLNALNNFMKVNGFLNTRNNDYCNQELGIILEDLHDENVLTQDGILKFIDTVFYLLPQFYSSN